MYVYYRIERQVTNSVCALGVEGKWWPLQERGEPAGPKLSI